MRHLASLSSGLCAQWGRNINFLAGVAEPDDACARNVVRIWHATTIALRWVAVVLAKSLFERRNCGKCLGPSLLKTHVDTSPDRPKSSRNGAHMSSNVYVSNGEKRRRVVFGSRRRDQVEQAKDSHQLGLRPSTTYDGSLHLRLGPPKPVLGPSALPRSTISQTKMKTRRLRCGRQW